MRGGPRHAVVAHPRRGESGVGAAPQLVPNEIPDEQIVLEALRECVARDRDATREIQNTRVRRAAVCADEMKCRARASHDDARRFLGHETNGCENDREETHGKERATSAAGATRLS
jgi:hypothetical protein